MFVKQILPEDRQQRVEHETAEPGRRAPNPAQARCQTLLIMVKFTVDVSVWPV